MNEEIKIQVQCGRYTLVFKPKRKKEPRWEIKDNNGISVTVQDWKIEDMLAQKFLEIYHD